MHAHYLLATACKSPVRMHNSYFHLALPAWAWPLFEVVMTVVIVIMVVIMVVLVVMVAGSSLG